MNRTEIRGNSRKKWLQVPLLLLLSGGISGHAVEAAGSTQTIPTTTVTGATPDEQRPAPPQPLRVFVRIIKVVVQPEDGKPLQVGRLLIPSISVAPETPPVEVAGDHGGTRPLWPGLQDLALKKGLPDPSKPSFLVYLGPNLGSALEGALHSGKEANRVGNARTILTDQKPGICPDQHTVLFILPSMSFSIGSPIPHFDLTPWYANILARIEPAGRITLSGAIHDPGLLPDKGPPPVENSASSAITIPDTELNDGDSFVIAAVDDHPPVRSFPSVDSSATSPAVGVKPLPKAVALYFIIAQELDITNQFIRN